MDRTDILQKLSDRIDEENAKPNKQESHNDLIWHIILGEEFGEVSRGIVDSYFSKDVIMNPRVIKAYQLHLIKELEDVSLVCIAWMEQLYREIENE